MASRFHGNDGTSGRRNPVLGHDMSCPYECRSAGACPPPPLSPRRVGPSLRRMPESRTLERKDYLPLSTSKGYLKSEDTRKRWIPVFTGMTEPVHAGSRCRGTTCRAPTQAVARGLAPPPQSPRSVGPSLQRMPESRTLERKDYLPLSTPKGYLKSEDTRRRWIPVFTGMTELVDAGTRCTGTTCRARTLRKPLRGGLSPASSLSPRSVGPSLRRMRWSPGFLIGRTTSRSVLQRVSEV